MMEGIDYVVGEAPIESIVGFFKIIVNEYIEALKHDMESKPRVPFDPSKTIEFFESELGIDSEGDVIHGPLTNMITNRFPEEYDEREFDQIRDAYMEGIYQKTRWVITALNTEAEKLEYIQVMEKALQPKLPTEEDYFQNFQETHA